MADLTYAEQLRHPNWQRKRLEALEAADFKCECCFDGETTLHVHHHQYFKGRMAWEYDLTQLSVLCADCHEKTHANKDMLMDVVSRLPVDGMKWIDRRRAAYLLAGAMGLDNVDLSDITDMAWFYTGLNIQAEVDSRVEHFRMEQKKGGEA